MYCLNCGKEIADTSKFCHFCGADQQEPENPNIPTAADSPRKKRPVSARRKKNTTRHNVAKKTDYPLSPQKPVRTYQDTPISDEAIMQPNRKRTALDSIIVILSAIILVMWAAFGIYKSKDPDTVFAKYKPSDEYYNRFGGQNKNNTKTKGSAKTSDITANEVDAANEKARIAYDYFQDYFDMLMTEKHMHFQDDLKHGRNTWNIEKNDDLRSLIGDGYAKIIKVDWDHYYDDRVVVQWCAKKSGEGVIGQYPNPISKQDQGKVSFGEIY